MRRCGLIILAGLVFCQGQPRVSWAQALSDNSEQTHSPATSRPSFGSTVVNGTVFDPSGGAIPHAKVVLSRSDGRTLAETLTDAGGTFRFEGVGPGAYSLTVQATGFEDLRRDFLIAKKAIPPIKLVLSIATEKQL